MKRQQYTSHVAEDENLPQEVKDFIELQIIKGFERTTREKVIPDEEGFRVHHVSECVCLCLCVFLRREGHKSFYGVFA